MEARFIGDPKHGFSGPKVFPLFGVIFAKNVWTGVDKLSAGEVAKLEGNSHFQTRQDDAAEPELPAAAEAEDGPADRYPNLSEAQEAALDRTPGDGDTSPGGSVSKDELILRLEAIPGATFNRNWGVPKLTAALEQAQFIAGDED